MVLLRRPLISLGLVVVLAPFETSATRQTFTSRIEAIRVDVLVTEDGQPVQGLTADDFEVLDNGVRVVTVRT